MKAGTDKNMFFILGRERSGTTLLRLLINTNANCYVPLESAFILALRKRYAAQSDISPKQLIQDLKTDPYFHPWKLDWEHQLKRLEKLPIKSYQSLCKAILNHQEMEITHLGDKNPVYCILVKQLTTLFPEAKFIWLIRDYRAHINSMLKVNFERKNIASLAVRWKKYNRSVEKLKERFPNQVLLVRYEDLVVSPEQKMKDIKQFLTVSGDFSLESLNKKMSEDNQLEIHHKSLKKRVSTDHVEEWKTGLNKKQIAISEYICNDFADKYGYTSLGTSISLTTKMAIFPSRLFGGIYIPFQRLLFAMPFVLKKVITEKIIQPNFKFWKESKEQYLNNE